ncbi:MAG: ABC transporter substrate-binding protein [Bdellovibrionaceae bacterium]|nr:ABC transporter substrate-binding protein [Pseudobdellovibrionaceae bacterium]
MTRRYLFFWGIFCSFVLSNFAARTVKAMDGVTDTQVLFGQSAALTGPAKGLGLNLQKGILAAFAEINSKKGVHGRRLKLKSLDDHYEPEVAIKNIYRLINKTKVFSLIGGVGTPTSKAVVPIVAKSKKLYIGPLTGAFFLRSSYRDTVVNVRASYFQEIRAMVFRLQKDLKIKRIAIFYQNDSYGIDGLNSLEKAVKEAGKGLRIVSRGSYLRNTMSVKTALLDIRKGHPEAIITIGTYSPVAHFIKWAEKLKIKSTVFLSVSFVGVNALAKKLKHSKSFVVVTQVVPFPHDRTKPFIRHYHRAMKKIKSLNAIGFVSLEGYIVGRLVIESLKRAGRNLTAKNFTKVFKEQKSIFNIDGFRLSYTKKNNQGSNRVFFTRLNKGKVFSIKTLKARAVFKNKKNN